MRWRILLWPLGVALAFFVDRLAMSPWVPFLAALWLMHAAVPMYRPNMRIELSTASCIDPALTVLGIMVIAFVRLLGFEAIWLFKLTALALAVATLIKMVRRLYPGEPNSHEPPTAAGIPARPVGPIVQTARSRRKTPEP